MKKCGRGICLQVKSFINLLRELSVNWGDRSSGEPEQHQLDEESPVNAEAVRGQQAIQISRCKEFFLVPFPQDLVTHVSKQQSIENFQTFYFVMKMKASDNLNQVKLSARAHSNFQTSLLSEAQYKEPASINPIGRNGKVQFQQKCQV